MNNVDGIIFVSYVCANTFSQDIPRGSSKYSSYSDVIKNFRPVFHHFFMENFPSPPQWFERRLAYTRSVAASSIGASSSSALGLEVVVYRPTKRVWLL